MRAQIPDIVRFENQTWDLIEVHGEGLFEPSQYSLPVVMVSTVSTICWRGYRCAYVVENGKLMGKS